MPTVKDLLVRDLNVKNSQSLSSSDLLIGLPSVGSTVTETQLTLSASSTGSIPTAGTTRITYNRVDLSVVSTIIKQNITVTVGDTFYEILPSIRRFTGLQFSESDFDDVPITWSQAGTATLVITPLSTSRHWVGTATLHLTLRPTNITRQYESSNLVITDDYITPQKIQANANAANGAYIPYSAVVIDSPIDTATNGLDTTHNTAVRVTAVEGSGYTGSTYLFYDRKTFGSVFGTSFNVLDDVVTGRDLVSYLNAIKPDAVAATDIVDSTINYGVVPASYALTAESASWTYHSSTQVSILRRSDSIQKINVNITADDTAYTESKLSQAILSAWNGSAAAVDVTINVAQNVTVVGASAANPTLVLKNYGGIGQINYYLNNLGSIYGRGGTGGVAVSTPGVNTEYPGTPGGSAIGIADSTTLLSITNHGRIAGGGAGSSGFYLRASSNGGTNNAGLSNGGGGAPFGDATATLTNQTVPTVVSPYNGTITTGPGGAVGCPSMPGKYTTSIPPGNITTFNLTTFANAGTPIAGHTENVTWVSRGIVLPLQTSDIVGPISTGLTGVYLEPTDSTKAAGYVGVASYLTLGTGQNLATMLGMTISGQPPLTALNQGNTSNWIKFYLDGKTLFIPLTGYGGSSYSILWNDIYNVGAVYGDDGPGAYPLTPAVTQNARVPLNGHVFRVRLMRGGANNPFDTIVGSEWNRLLYYICNATFAAGARPGIPWAANTPTDMGMSTYLFRSWMQESAASPTTSRLQRGMNAGGTPDITGSSVIVGTAASQGNAWRPVLEYVKTTNLSEYTRFTTWLTTQGFYNADAETGTHATSNMTANLGKPITKRGIAGTGTLNGTPYNAAFTSMSNVAATLRHAYPDNILYLDTVANSRVCMFVEVAVTGTAAVAAGTRNGLANGATAAGAADRRMTRFVYFDWKTEMMMEYNPSTASTPIPFTWVA